MCVCECECVRVCECVHACTNVSKFTCTVAMQKRPPLGPEHSATAEPREHSIYKHLSQVAWGGQSGSQKGREGGTVFKTLSISLRQFRLFFNEVMPCRLGMPVKTMYISVYLCSKLFTTL